MKFQTLEVWQLSYEAACDTYKQCRSLRDRGFKDQITRSALSVPSNIAEGVERQSYKEQVQFLYIAKGSLAELITQAMIGRDIGYLDDAFVQALLIRTEEISRMFGALIRTISSKVKR